jgi:hypothetical protein
MKETNHGHWMFRDKPPFFKGVHIAGRVVLGIAAAAVFALVFGVLVMLLWNWLMPLIFNLPEIGYWQAFGIVILVKLVFGTIGHRHQNKDWHNSREKWSKCVPNGHDWMNTKEHEHWHDFWDEEGRERFEAYIRSKEHGKNEASDQNEAEKQT